jgi:hypothetical protein
MTAHDLIEVQPATIPASASESGAFLAMIERAARDPNVNIANMRALMDMKKEVETDASRRAFNSAMALCQAEIKPVAKNAENRQTNSRYSTLDAIDAAVSPIYTKHGFALSFDTGESNKPDCYRILCEVTHSDGFAKNYHADIPVDGAGIKGVANKTATHAFVSTTSYGRRVLTMMIFNVTSRAGLPDDDGNSAGGRVEPETIGPEQLKKLNDRIADLGQNPIQFRALLGVESFADIYANKFDAAMSLLSQKAARK